MSKVIIQPNLNRHFCDISNGFLVACNFLLQFGDHVVESGSLLDQVVDLLPDVAVLGERSVEADHDAVQAILQEDDPLANVAFLAHVGRGFGRGRT